MKLVIPSGARNLVGLWRVAVRRAAPADARSFVASLLRMTRGEFSGPASGGGGLLFLWTKRPQSLG
jgi:hypothetical protein